MKARRAAGVGPAGWGLAWTAAVWLGGASFTDAADRIIDVNGSISGRMEWAKHLELLSPGSSPPDDPHASGFLTASLTVTPVDALEGRLTIGSREVSRRTLDDGRLEARWDANRFIDEAFVRLKVKKTWIRVGKQRVITGDGLIVDDYQPAVAVGATFDGESVSRVRVKAVVAGLDQDGVLREGQSLHGAITVELRPSLFHRVWFSVAQLSDRDGLIDLPASVVVGVLVPREALIDPEEGRVTWWMVGGDALARGWSLEGVGILQTGAIEVTASDPLGVFLSQSRSIRTNGLAGRVDVSYAMTDSLTLGGFALYSSGDGRQPSRVWEDQRYDGFLSIFPFINDTNLFFRGGVNQSLETGRTASSGVDGRGVVALGADAEWERGRFSNHTVVAHLWSEYPAVDNGGTSYGWELDTELGYQATPWLTIRVEGDVLFTGSFFEDSTSLTPGTISKAVVGVDVLF